MGHGAVLTNEVWGMNGYHDILSIHVTYAIICCQVRTCFKNELYCCVRTHTYIQGKINQKSLKMLTVG